MALEARGVIANRVRHDTTRSRHLPAQIETLEPPRVGTTLSQTVAFGELGFRPGPPSSGEAAVEIAALMAGLRSLG